MTRNVCAAALRSLLAVAAIVSLTPAVANAQAADAKNAIANLSFLLGTWQNGRGTVADTGQTSTGTSTFTSEAGGAAIVRRDHTDLFDKTGKRAGSFDQVMMIYADGAKLRADYTDGTHVIHYTNVTVMPDMSVEFDTQSPPGAPNFRLTYAHRADDDLDVRFEISGPGQTDFHPIATGSLTRGAK